LKVDNSNLGKIINSFEGAGISHQTYADIGRYTVFPEAHSERMFPGKQFFGNFYNEEYKRSKIFGVMTREEGLRLTNDLSRLTLPHERNVNYQQILRSQPSEIKEDIIKDELNFVAV